MSILNHFFDYKPEVLALDEKAMELCQPYFRQMEEIRDFNQLKMLKAFADTQMSSTDMLGTTGYGLWDTGRAKLEQDFCAGHGRRGCTGAQPVPKRHPHAGGGAVRSAAGRGHPAGRHRPPLRYAGGRHWSGRQGQGHRHSDGLRRKL